MQAPPKVPESIQHKFNAIYASALTGDRKAVEACRTNPEAQSPYPRKLHQYKLDVLAVMASIMQQPVIVNLGEPKPPAAIPLPIAETYDDVQKLIWHTCYRFARRYGGDVEEMISEANVIYMKAYESWEPGNGTKFSSYLTTCIWRRLIGMRNFARRNKVLWGASLDAPQPNGRTMAAHVADQHGDHIGILEVLASLSEDAASVVQLVVDTPADLMGLVQGKGGTPRNWSSCIRHRLRKLGWEASRITETFEEIGGALVG